MNAKNVPLTDSELSLLIVALETEKRALCRERDSLPEGSAARAVAALNLADVIALRNRLRNA